MLLHMSITGGILIIFIIFLRLLAINRLPKKIFMLLWDIALLRLLLPLNLPFPYSISTPAAKIADTKLLTFTKAEVNFPEITVGAPAISAETGFSQTADILNNLPLLIWLLGTMTLLIIFTTLYVRERRKVQDALPLAKETEEDLKRLIFLPKRVRILVSDRLSTPLTCGILSPKIILSDIYGTMDCAKLKYVLTHELIHIKRADNFCKLMMLAAVCIHWFNPAVWMMLFLYNRDIELSCDEKVIQILGENNKKDYAMALVTLTEQTRSRSLFSTGFGKNTTKERIVAIMKYKKATVFSIIIAVLSIGGAITVFAKNEASDTEVVDISSSYQHEANTSDQKRPMEEFYASFIHSENYPEYEKLGLSYDVSTNHLMYDGHIVAYFHDNFSPSSCTHITDNIAGDIETIGITVSRDADYNILAFEKVDVPVSTGNDTTREYAGTDNDSAVAADMAIDITYQTESADSASDTADQTKSADSASDIAYQAVEVGDASLAWNDDYAQYGISYDTTEHVWKYNGKTVAGIWGSQQLMIDETDTSADTVYLKITEDDTVIEISRKQFMEYLETVEGFTYIP